MDGYVKFPDFKSYAHGHESLVTQRCIQTHMSSNIYLSFSFIAPNILDSFLLKGI